MSVIERDSFHSLWPEEARDAVRVLCEVLGVEFNATREIQIFPDEVVFTVFERDADGRFYVSDGEDHAATTTRSFPRRTVSV